MISFQTFALLMLIIFLAKGDVFNFNSFVDLIADNFFRVVDIK
jgi:hypothetical protein